MPDAFAYDPEGTPEAELWLALDEAGRLRVVQDYHVRHRIPTGNATAHAMMHTIVETQLAMTFDPTVRVLSRLRQEGLCRHDALHAIGAVILDVMSKVVRRPSRYHEPDAVQAAVTAAIEQLSASSWRRDFSG